MSKSPESGCKISVRVTPRSSQNKLELQADESIKLWTTSAPTDGQANDSVCKMIAKALGVSKTAVSIAHGDTSRNKVVFVEGISFKEAITRLSNQA